MWRGGLRSCGMRGKDLSLDGGLAWPLPHAERRPVTPRIELPDDQLAVQALAGDRDAWGALIARHDHKVVVALLARGVALAQARELAHQAWIRLIAQQRAGRLDRLELPGLAIRQASFLALDAARRRAAGTRGETTADADAVAGPEASIEDRLIGREQLARAEAELARCSPQARKLFALLYGNPGMRHAEAARRLGLSVQRVRQTLCEVRARLRVAIEQESPDD
jgi:RNA polymerase sigma factor (sigma-70 family)